MFKESSIQPFPDGHLSSGDMDLFSSDSDEGPDPDGHVESGEGSSQAKAILKSVARRLNFNATFISLGSSYGEALGQFRTLLQLTTSPICVVTGAGSSKGYYAA